eukprot:gene7920-9439_t
MHARRPATLHKFWKRLDKTLASGKPVAVIIYGDMFVVDEMSQFDEANLEKELCVDRDVILIVGDPIGLEKELVLDLAFACKRAKLSESLTEKILTSVCTGDGLIGGHDADRVHRYMEDKGRLQLISNPPVESFKRLFVDAVSRVTARFSVEIIYCGHGGDDGSIAFHDGDYSLRDLSKLIIKNKLSHSPQLRLLLNCCYASSLVKEFLFQESGVNLGEAAVDPVLDSLVTMAGIRFLSRGDKTSYMFGHSPLAFSAPKGFLVNIADRL